MSYDIELVDTECNVCEVGRHWEGGSHPCTGSTRADLNMTYNYSEYFYRHIDNEQGIRWLCGKTGEECTPKLHAAIRELGTVQDDDYWKATPGNAGFALSILLKWAKQYPNAIFRGD